MRALVVLVVLVLPMTAMADTSVFAVVVANNGSYDRSRDDLRYADDDGARYYELFALMGAEPTLLTVMDAATQRIFPTLVPRTVAPSTAELSRSLAATFAKIEAAKARGERTVFYFVYTGHGEVTGDKEGYVHLLDGPFRRRDLFNDVIAASPADVNHVVVDACNAYFMVASRGGAAKPAGDYSDLVRSLVSRESLDAHPNTGVVLATTAAVETHEWSRFEAGVFSHELRSALAGAADANADGAIDYTEVAAFLAAANGGVQDPKARVQALARAPRQNLREPLARLPSASAQVVMPEEWSGRYALEDDRKVRVADMNKSSGKAVTLHVTPERSYTVRSQSESYQTGVLPVGSPLYLASLSPSELPSHSRGDEGELFSQPFDAEYVAGFEHATAQAPDVMLNAPRVEPYRVLDTVRIGALGVGVAGLTAGIVMKVLANNAASDYRSAAGDANDVAALRERAEARDDAATVLGAIGITGLATAAGITVYEWLAD